MPNIKNKANAGIFQYTDGMETGDHQFIHKDTNDQQKDEQCPYRKQEQVDQADQAQQQWVYQLGKIQGESPLHTER